MFYTLTKKTLIITLIIILCLALPIAISLTVIASVPKDTLTILIDAGHGGVDCGSYGVKTGVKESELNLAISKILENYFKDAGFKVIMTRNTSEGLYGLKTPGFKKRDMNNRKNIIIKNKPDILLSIHMNYYTSSVRRGLQVFYSDTGESKALAKEIQKTANRNINMPIIGRNLSELYGDYFILQCIKVPSVIVECGFLSNPLDESLLISPEYQLELSYYIFTGVMSYINCNM